MASLIQNQKKNPLQTFKHVSPLRTSINNLKKILGKTRKESGILNVAQKISERGWGEKKNQACLTINS